MQLYGTDRHLRTHLYLCGGHQGYLLFVEYLMHHLRRSLYLIPEAILEQKLMAEHSGELGHLME
jgi:hypothetical protein